jgi:hypothetical protein
MRSRFCRIARKLWAALRQAIAAAQQSTYDPTCSKKNTKSATLTNK